MMARRCRIPAHGHRGRYAYHGCRCDLCRDANRIYEKRRRQGRAVTDFVPAIGTQRRIQALVAFGYGMRTIADHLGVTRSRVFEMARRAGPRGVLRRTAAEVDALFQSLSAQPPPTGRSTTYARTVAARHGWVPPLAWDDDAIDDPDAQPWTGPARGAAPVVDEVAVQRALHGEQLKLTRLERHHAVHAGQARMPLYAVAAVLRMSYGQAQDLSRKPLPVAAEEAAA